MKHVLFTLAGMISLTMISLGAGPAQAGLYLVGEAGFASLDPDIEAAAAVEQLLDREEVFEDDNFRATLGIGYGTTLPVLGFYAGVEASASLSFVESDAVVDYDVGNIDLGSLAGISNDFDTFATDYKVSEDWRVAVSGDVGMRVLPGMIAFVRVSYVEVGEDIVETGRRAFDSAAEIGDCDESCLDTIADALQGEARPDGDALSGEEIGVGLLYHVPFIPLSVRGIITVDPETAFSVALLYRF